MLVLLWFLKARFMGGCNACLVSLVDGELFSAEPNRRRHASLEYFVHELTIDRQMESSR